MSRPLILLPLLMAACLITSKSQAAEKTPAEQQALARTLGNKVQRFEMWTDAKGNVTGLIFINHQALTKMAGPKPGITDDDLARLVHFPKLESINIEAQPVSDKGLAVLQKSSHLKQVGFHYMAKAQGANASPNFITLIDGLQDLEILEIKHNFRMEAINADKLKGPFPKVWRLVLDTPLTAQQTMHLVKLCPNVTDLQLHRSHLSADQLAEVGKLLPKLEVLWWKPKGPLTVGHLESLKNFPKLKIYSPQQFKNRLPYQDGWEILMTLPALERLEIAGPAASANAEALKQLKQARPKLVIDSKLTRSRNYQGL